MYKMTYLSNSSHAKLSKLRDTGRIKSVMSFVNKAVNKALDEFESPEVLTTQAQTNEIVITIKINGGHNTYER